MASRSNSVVFAGTSVALAGAILAVCDGCDPATKPATEPDSGMGERPDIIPERDGADTSAEEEACARILEPSGDCQHPPVVEQCDGGWCRIPHGCFIMGSPPCEFGRGRSSENQVQVTLTRDFEIQQTEMTQADWVALGFANPSRQIEAGTPLTDGGTPVDISYGDCLDPTCPVGNVALEEAMAAANELSEQVGLPHCYALSGCSGNVGGSFACASRGLTTATTYECLGYRLPTEAEWEYATRAGTKTAFYDGDILASQGCTTDPVLDQIGWYCMNSGNYAHPVGQKKRNGWGLFDVAGNAAEWTTSDYTGGGYGEGPLRDPSSSLGMECVVHRGGFAHFLAILARSAARSQCARGSARGPLIGFRLVRTLP